MERSNERSAQRMTHPSQPTWVLPPKPTPTPSLPTARKPTNGGPVDQIGMPSLLKYPSIGTEFPDSITFTKTYRTLFGHIRNAKFIGFNNTSSAIYVCPNYTTCGGVLHGVYKKLQLTDEQGNTLHDKNGHAKRRPNAPFVISDLTRPCNCGPVLRCSLAHAHDFANLQGIPNVPRSEFTHLVHAYFLPGGTNSYQFHDLGQCLTWKCLACGKGQLTLRRTPNPKGQPPRYQPYGTITCARACPSSCPTHRIGIAPKCFWLPRPAPLQSTKVTKDEALRDLRAKKQWAAQGKQIAKKLLRKRHLRKRRSGPTNEICWNTNHNPSVRALTGTPP